MPYSDSHRYVHIRVPKTGSTSVSRLLEDFHEQYGGSRLLKSELVDKAFRKKYGLNAIGDRRPKRAGHLSALQLHTILGEKYQEYFSFSFVRNPWARTVSRYHYTHIDNFPSEAEIAAKRKRGNIGPLRKFHSKTFEEWVKWKHGLHLVKRMSPNYFLANSGNQICKLCDTSSNVIVDFVGKLENFEQDLEVICERIGFPIDSVPHRNKTSHAHYTEYYNDKTRKMVEEMCGMDIERFGYRFGD